MYQLIRFRSAWHLLTIKISTDWSIQVEVKLLLLLLATVCFAQTPAELQRRALDLQRAAAQRQAEAVGAHMKPWSDVTVQPGPAFDCPSMEESASAPIVEGAAKQQGLDTKLLRAVIEEESGFHPCAVSPKGAQGLMQLMPDTAATLNVGDAFDPKQNIEGGAKYLKQLLDKNNGDVAKALGAYNAGPNATDPANTIPETKAYVDAILTKLGIKRTDPPSIPMPKPIEN